ENSPDPNPDEAADTMILMPSATRAWCQAHLGKPPDEQRHDPVLRKLLNKHREIALKNGSLQADLFDLKASYVYGLARYRSPFRAQWRRVKPSTNPEVAYDDYRQDPKFVSDIDGIRSSGVPVLFVHFALGSSISEGREFDLDNRSRNLLGSLRDLSGS